MLNLDHNLLSRELFPVKRKNNFLQFGSTNDMTTKKGVFADIVRISLALVLKHEKRASWTAHSHFSDRRFLVERRIREVKEVTVAGLTVYL